MSTILSDIGATIGTVALRNVLSAGITLIICLIVIRLVMRVLEKALSRSKLDQQIRKYILTGIRLALYVVSALIVVDSLGIKITSLVALLSVGSLGLTLAAEDILGNMAGGLVILTSRPFSVGDFIETSGICGTVAEISLNHTKLNTPDGHMVMLPNQELASTTVINYSVLGLRRVTYKVTASYDAPTAAVRAACQEALAATALIADPSRNEVHVSNYGESSIEYTIFCWTPHQNYWPVYYGLIENLRAAFERHDVEMTYNHMNVHIIP